MMAGAPHCYCWDRSCQECRDAADAEREAQEYDAWISRAVMVHRHLAVVLCGGCEKPMEALAETVGGMKTITTQRPCPCGWGTREG